MSVCKCGYDGELYVLHGLPSMRAFVLCPKCCAQTSIYASEEMALAAWDKGDVFRNPDTCPNCVRYKKCRGYPDCAGYHLKDDYAAPWRH